FEGSTFYQEGSSLHASSFLPGFPAESRRLIQPENIRKDGWVHGASRDLSYGWGNDCGRQCGVHRGEGFRGGISSHWWVRYQKRSVVAAWLRFVGRRRVGRDLSRCV